MPNPVGPVAPNLPPAPKPLPADAASMELLSRVTRLEAEIATRRTEDAERTRIAKMDDETRAAQERQSDALKDRLDMAEKMFRSIMDVDTHLDNKAQRTLGAVAFLTAATTAIFTTAYKPVVVRTSAVAPLSVLSSAQGARPAAAPAVVATEVQQIAEPMPAPAAGSSGGQDVQARVDAALQSVPTQYARSRFRQTWGFATPLLCFFGFVASVLVSVALYLAALGPSFHLRLRKSGDNNFGAGAIPAASPFRPDDRDRIALDPERPGPHEDATHTGSLLFFRSIAAMPTDALLRAWNIAQPTEPVDDLRRRLLESYVYEAQVVAQKAVAKFRYLSTASILLRVALVFLGVLVASLVADVDRQFVLFASLALGGLFGAFAFEMGYRPSEYGRDLTLGLTVLWATAAFCAFAIFLITAIGGRIPF